jgi:hypothetical protein
LARGDGDNRLAATALVLNCGEDELLIGVEEVLYGLGGERGRPPHPLRKIYTVLHDPDGFKKLRF